MDVIEQYLTNLMDVIEQYLTNLMDVIEQYLTNLMNVIENLVTLPAFIFSVFYASAIIYHTCMSRRRTRINEYNFVSLIFSSICMVAEGVTIYFAWTYWVLTLQLVEVESSIPFLCYDLSKFIELSFVLFQICCTNHRIKHIHVSIEVPMLILADYAYNYSNVQPMIILILFNSVTQIMVHFSHIIHTIVKNDVNVQEDCWCLTESSIICYQTLEYLALLVICVIGWYQYEYVGLNIILSIIIFTFATTCCLFKLLQTTKCSRYELPL